MAKYVVNQWTQVEWNGEKLTGGDTFEGDPEQVVAEGLSQYVTPVPEDPEPVEDEAEKPKAKPAASNKARKASPNK